ncbi:MFS transporter [Catenovulum sediminis]|uniref:MFS transporter n=1 Tax=Catenovulum sediminis TaxID=1740262 RepID=A0ABV1RMZ4_9ALTE|nr:MFS transporter [Catenovulum sediminis]
MNFQTLQLLSKRRFLPYFCTQALGAFNDNVYKNSLLLIIAFMLPQSTGYDVNLLVNLAAVLFILPFFIFSGHAGVLADNFEKSTLVRKIKMLEVAIMLLAALAIVSVNIEAMLVLLFLMGAQSTYFGPIKYSILPIHLKENELLAGNALVEMGTFVAILSGTLIAGLFMSMKHALMVVAIAVVVFAVKGLVCAYFIPSTPFVGTQKPVKFHLMAHNKSVVSLIVRNKELSSIVVLISWFWFFGASYLTQIPNFVQLHLVQTPAMVSVLLAVFTLGVALGSMLCSALSKGMVKLSVVWLAACGLSFSSLAFYGLTPEVAAAEYSQLSDIWQNQQIVWVLLNMFVLGAAGGLYIVPLYTLLQLKSAENNRSQVIAATNIFNALFMVMSAIVAIIWLTILSFSIPAFYGLLGILNILVVLFFLPRLKQSITDGVRE